MNIQPAPQELATNLHLTADQFGDLLTTSSSSPAVEAHLCDCDECAAEVTYLRESISRFRQASIASADHQLRALPPLSLPQRSMFSPYLHPATWAAAAAILLAAFLPMQALRQHSIQPSAPAAVSNSGQDQSRSAESDDALLQDVDRDISASVPSSMQALADPTADTSTTLQTTTQRKD